MKFVTIDKNSTIIHNEVKIENYNKDQLQINVNVVARGKLDKIEPYNITTFN